MDGRKVQFILICMCLLGIEVWNLLVCMFVYFDMDILVDKFELGYKKGI